MSSESDFWNASCGEPSRLPFVSPFILILPGTNTNREKHYKIPRSRAAIGISAKAPPDVPRPDALHSFSDLVTDVLILFALRFSGHPAGGRLIPPAAP